MFVALQTPLFSRSEWTQKSCDAWWNSSVKKIPLKRACSQGTRARNAPHHQGSETHPGERHTRLSRWWRTADSTPPVVATAPSPSLLLPVCECVAWIGLWVGQRIPLSHPILLWFLPALDSLQASNDRWTSMIAMPYIATYIQFRRGGSRPFSPMLMPVPKCFRFWGDFSKTWTLMPPSRNPIPIAKPAMPPPTIATSTSIAILDHCNQPL